MTAQVEPVVRLMIVNERKEVVEAISRYVAQFPYVSAVGTAHSLEDSLQCARELRPGAVLCDYQRIRAETLERIRRLRQELQGACLIAMSYDDEQAAEVLAAGADQFIAKFELGRLLLPALNRCGERLA